ncbi:hypothetical protein SK128_002168 [Halocaridina rubra]|uniref:Uncharacterized protein n=1 Tax=Halocaridina rubra TaxID=373956 RepID=A0AAN8X3P0_HALRR
MEMTWLKLGVTVADKIESELPGYRFSLRTQNDTLCPCDGCTVDKFPCGLATMTFQRKYTSYLLTIYLPSGLFVGVAWLSFTWPPEVIPGRTVLIITSLLTVISMYGSVR